MKRKICVVITARPSYSRVKTALEEIQKHPDLQLQLVLAASALLDRYGRVESQILEDGFTIDARVQCVIEGESPSSMAKTTGLAIIELSSVFESLQPDVVVTIADRFETLATATAATFMGIPLAHIQGGEVSGSIDERVRHAITKLADIHLPATHRAASLIAKMGEDPNRIFVVGCPSIDLAKRVIRMPKLSFELFDIYGGVGPRFSLDEFIVVLQHPVTTEYSAAREQVEVTLGAIKSMGLKTLLFWPNVDAGSDGTSKGIRAFRESNSTFPLHVFKNVAPDHFLEILLHAKCLVGNSSVAIREGAFLGIPAVNIGSRQNGRERGRNVIDVMFDERKIVEAVSEQMESGVRPTDLTYGDGESGREIARLLSIVDLSATKQLLYEDHPKT